MTAFPFVSYLVSFFLAFLPPSPSGLDGAESHSPEFSTESWRIEPDPVVTIGVLEGPDEYVLTNPIDIVVLGDGTIVIVLAQSRLFELRYYDDGGTFLRKVGRWGQGPFEVSQPILLLVDRVPGDSILVYSIDTRYSLFGPNGEKVRSGRLSDIPPFSFASSIDASNLGIIGQKPLGSGWENRVVPTEMTFSVYSLITGELDTLGTYVDPGYWHADDGGTFNLPFPTPTHWDGGNGVFWYGSSEDQSIQRYSVSEAQLRPIEFHWPREAVTRSMEARYRERELRGASEDRRRDLREYHRQIEYPDSVPAFQDIVVDKAGNLWVLRYELPWSEEDYTWDIYDPTGEWLTTGTAPFGILHSCLRRDQYGRCSLDTYEITEDHLLTIVRDELGIPRVKKYRLVKE